MSFFGTIWRSMENPRSPLDPWHQVLGSNIDGDMASSGVRVNRDRALTVPAFWRAINLLVGTISTLPLGCYRRVHPGIELDNKHPAHWVLRVEPNEAMTAVAFKETMVGHLILHGNAYAYIVRRQDGTPLELWPLDSTSNRTYPVMAHGKVSYVHVLKSGEHRKIAASDMLHFKGWGCNGLEGYGVLAKAREALGLALATQSYASVFFRNAARPSVVLTHPAKLSAEARRNLRESWERMHSGLDNAHRTAILEEGLQAKELTITARDSQLIESRQFSLLEIANLANIPPHKLGANVNVSYKSLEQENQAFLDESINPWLVRIEEEGEAKLLSRFQRARYSHAVLFDRFGLVRADMEKRYAAYNTAIMGGWMSPDEARARDGLNPQPGSLGKVFYRPKAMSMVGMDPDGVDGPAVAPGTKLLEVPDIRQQDDFDCGPAAVQSVCSFWDVGPTDRQAYIDGLGTDQTGTTPAAILGFLGKQGLVTTAGGGLKVTDLARWFSQGSPVLCPIQAGDPVRSSSGHWVVVVGTGLGQIFVQDPELGLRMLSEAEWMDRWHDFDRDGNRFDQYGIAVADEVYTPPPLPADDGDDPPEKPGSGIQTEDPDEGDRNGKITHLLRRVLGEAMMRMVRRVTQQARREAGDPKKFMNWLDRMKSEGLEQARLAFESPMLALRHGRGLPMEGASEEILDVAGRLLDELHAGLLETSGLATRSTLFAAVDGWGRKVENMPDEEISVYREWIKGEEG